MKNETFTTSQEAILIAICTGVLISP